MRRSLLALLALAACGGPKSTGPKTPPPELGKGSGSGAGTAVVADPKAAPPPAVDESRPLAMDAAVRTGTLANGLTYYVKANKKPEKRVQLWLAVNSGSVLEDDDQRGYSHLLEHIAFQGTKRFPKHDIQDFIERSGMRFGADLNAYTSFDETVYQLMVPTEDPKIVDKGIDVLRDWSSEIAFDPKAVLDERRIIEEERRTRNSEQYRMLQQIIPVAYQGSKYAQRLPIGTVDVIAAATADKLRKLYQSWYRPEMMAVIVVGDIDPAAMEQELKAKFADVPKAAATAPRRPIATVNTELPTRMIVARDKEQAVFEVDLSYQMPHRPQVSTADVRRLLVESMFSHLVNARLATISKRATSAWTTAHVGIGTGLRPVDELSLGATPKTGKVLDAIGDLTAEMARVRQHGFAADEMDEARAALLQEFDEAAKEADTRESRPVAEEMVRNFLTHEQMSGPQKELDVAKAILPTITTEQVVAIAKGLGDKGRMITLEAPPKGDAPSELDVTKRIAAAAVAPIGEWQAVDLTQPLIAAEPKPGSVTAEKALTNGIVQWTLSNGATMYLKKTDFKADEVTITAVSNGGTSQVSDADFAQAQFASAIVNASGIGNYTVEDLAKKLAGKKVSVETTIDDQQEKVVGVTSPDDLEPTLQLMYAAFTAPRKDPGAFDAWRTQQLMTAKIIDANSQAKFLVGAFNFLFQNNARLPLPFPTEKRIEAIKLDAAITQYGRRFANAADFAFVVVGNYDVAKLKPLVEKYLASLPAQKGKHETVQDVKLRTKKGIAGTTIKAGSEAKSLSLLVATNPAPWSFAVEADADILQHVLQLQLLELLREKLGGTYSVTVQAQSGRTPPQQSLALVFFECDPARATSMQAEAWKALDALATTPVKDDTLAKVKEQIQKSHDAELLENEFWTTALVRVARYGDLLDTLLDAKHVTSQVTADHIKKIAAQMIGKQNRLTITLLPEDAAPAPAAKP